MQYDYLGNLHTLDLTHVQYSLDDPWGPYWAIVTLSPVLILAVYIAAFLQRRETIYVNVFLGQVLCEAVNSRLKKHIQQPRPTNILGTGYGMPSSHAQFSGFFCAFWGIHILAHWPKHRARLARGLYLRQFEQFLSLVLIILLTVLTCYSRHRLMYHSPAQIHVGLSTGLVIGALYYMLTEYLLRTSSILTRCRVAFYRSLPSRLLRLRDDWIVWPQGPAEETYTCWLHSLSKPVTKDHAVDASHPAHLRMLLLALQEADHCDLVPTAFSVGCVIAVNGTELCRELPEVDEPMEPLLLTTGYSRELPGNTHAEECAMEKLARHCARTPHVYNISEARQREPLELVLYTTMEPCSERLSGNLPCAQRIQAFNQKAPMTSAFWLAKIAQDANGAVLRTDLDTTLRPLRISLVIQGVREPDDFVKCQSSRILRSAGIDVLSASPDGSPSALGLTCPNLSSIPIRVMADNPKAWLEDACLRMARKGHTASDDSSPAT